MLVFSDLFAWTIQNEKESRYKVYSVKPNSSNYKSIQNGHRPDCSYVRESLTQQEEKTYLPRSLPIQSNNLRLVTESNTNASTPEDNTNIEGMISISIRMSKFAPSLIKPNYISNLDHMFLFNSSIDGYNQNGAIDRYIKSEPTLSDNQRMTAGCKRRLDEEGHTSEEGDGKRSRYTESQLFTLPPSLQISPKPDMSLVDENIAVNDAQPEQKHPDLGNTFIQSSGIHPIFALIFDIPLTSKCVHRGF